MKKKHVWLLIGLMILVFTGCGKKENIAGEDINETVQTEAEEKTQSGGQDAQAVTEKEKEDDNNDSAAEPVFNNGGTFIKVGTKVYYRQYGGDAYSSAALFGEFINQMPCSQECAIMCYDEAVGGAAVEVMADNGTGTLVYGDGYLFSTCYESWDEAYVYAMNPAERTSDKICDGIICCVEKDTGRYVVTKERDELLTVSVYQGKEQVDSFIVKNMQPFREMRLQGDYLVYRVVDVDADNIDQLWVRNIKDKTNLLLGDIPDAGYEGIYYGKDLDQIVICEDTVYAAVGFYAGTGYFYNDGYMSKAALAVENSLEEVDWSSAEVVPWVKEDDAAFSATTLLESTLPALVRTDRQMYSVSEDYDTEYINVVLPGNTEEEPIVKNVVQVAGAFGEMPSMIIERKEYVDGTVYMIIDNVAYNEGQSIGWRYAYDAKSVRYVCVDVETGMMRDIQTPIETVGSSVGDENVVSYYIENPAAGESYGASDKAAAPIPFTELSKDVSDYIDSAEWMDENHFTGQELECPGYTFRLNNAYERGTHRGYCLLVYGEDLDGISYEIDLSDFYDPVNCLPEEYLNSGWQAEYRYAYVENDILYVSMSHMTYASSMPYNAYILAIQLSDGTLLWKSKPLTCNSNDFLLIDDVIVCGYGFTAEDDFLYQISKYTGEIVQMAKLKSKAYYIFYRDGQLYVQTYNTAYVYTR